MPGGTRYTCTGAPCSCSRCSMSGARARSRHVPQRAFGSNHPPALRLEVVSVRVGPLPGGHLGPAREGARLEHGVRGLCRETFREHGLVVRCIRQQELVRSGECGGLWAGLMSRWGKGTGLVGKSLRHGLWAAVKNGGRP